ncbi:2Fe-2S iron-sulfur cluster-binding protein [Curvivirga sp.]|uniref:2Fe-2S iron-sulfur cluster-binding protein n=1 Tax=Curvivirga sp. TaxID=2856848 RepID=UPI003B5BAF52
MATFTIVDRDGSKKEITAADGESLMEAVLDNDVDIEAACEGSLACATCHLVLDQETYDKLGEPSEDETDMLDLAFGLTATSRLSCQVKVSPELDGATITVPEE